MNLSEGMHGGTLVLRDRAKLELDGVQDVASFDEATVLLQTALGGMTVEGSGLHITRLDLEKGLLTVEGQLCGVFYTAEPGDKKKGGFLSRLVK